MSDGQIPKGVLGPLPRRHLFGLDFVDAEIEQVVEALTSPSVVKAAESSMRLPVVVTPNVDQLVHLDRDTDQAASSLIRQAAWVLPDGQPIVWASKLLGKHLRSRLAGSDLVAELFPRLMSQNRSVLVIATSDEIVRRVRAETDSAVAIVAPKLDLNDRSSFDRFVESCVEIVQQHQPSHVFVTLGFPKQCNIIAGMIARLHESPAEAPLYLAVGASFDMHYGLVRRAPRWAQRSGLEWAFRLFQEPRRLFKRYLIDDMAFLRIVLREYRSRRSDRPT